MSRYPFRRLFVAVEASTALAGAAGAVQLLAGIATPPDGDLPFGWTTWTLPAIWLFAVVAVPSSVAALLALRFNRRAPLAVVVAALLLAVELAVQVPFVGTNVLQVVFGLVAAAMGGLAWRARLSWCRSEAG